MSDRAREPMPGAHRLTRMNVGRPLIVVMAVVLLAACTGSAASTEAPAATTPVVLGSPTVSPPASPPATGPAPSPSPTVSASSTESASSPPAASPQATPRATPRASVSPPTPVPTTPPAVPTPATLGVSGRVTAGPTCPVMRIPPDPSCADRPVEGAILVVTDTAGHEVARTTSSATGGFSVPLQPGSYVLVPQPVQGLMGTAPKADFTIPPSGPSVTLDIQYDTGIR